MCGNLAAVWKTEIKKLSEMSQICNFSQFRSKVSFEEQKFYRRKGISNGISLAKQKYYCCDAVWFHCLRAFSRCFCLKNSVSCSVRFFLLPLATYSFPGNHVSSGESLSRIWCADEQGILRCVWYRRCAKGVSFTCPSVRVLDLRKLTIWRGIYWSQGFKSVITKLRCNSVIVWWW